MKSILIASAILSTIAVPALASISEREPIGSSIRASNQAPGAVLDSRHGSYAYRPTVATPRGGDPSRFGNRAPVFDPENPYDPDPRIGGSFKMNTSGND